jgi:PAS domain S-box-containing protein
MSDSSLLESVLDSSLAFMCVLDSEGVILNASDSFASLVGPRGRESLKGQQIRTVMRGRDDLEPLLAPIGAVTSGAISPCPVVVAVYEGREKPLWAKFSFARVVSSNGPLVLLTGCDVTAEVDEKRRSEQRAHERSSLLVRMSNEIRTPLNTVLGYAQLMQGLHDLSPVASEYLATIIANENALLELINNVLELSKYESGQTDVTSGETDLRELISGVAKAHADLFERKGISLTVDVDASVPDVVLTDASKVRQIVSNVVGNALKLPEREGNGFRLCLGSPRRRGRRGHRYRHGPGRARRGIRGISWRVRRQGARRRKRDRARGRPNIRPHARRGRRVGSVRRRQGLPF